MAIWEKLFSKITFKDYPDTSTPLNASNMNALSDTIDGIDDRVVELNSKLNGISSIECVRKTGTRDNTYNNVIQLKHLGVTENSIIVITPKTQIPSYINRISVLNDVIQVVCATSFAADTEYTFDIVIFN